MGEKRCQFIEADDWTARRYPPGVYEIQYDRESA